MRFRSGTREWLIVREAKNIGTATSPDDYSDVLRAHEDLFGL